MTGPTFQLDIAPIERGPAVLQLDDVIAKDAAIPAPAFLATAPALVDDLGDEGTPFGRKVDRGGGLRRGERGALIERADPRLQGAQHLRTLSRRGMCVACRMMVLNPMRQRFEVAIGEVSALPCPFCSIVVFGPGWWCDPCGRQAYPDAHAADDEEGGDHESEEHS